MRIEIVVSSILIGGAERQALLAARGLARRGCDVELLYYHPSDGGYDPGLAGDARVILLQKEGPLPAFMSRLRQHLVERRVDVVHSYLGTPCLYGGLAAWMARVPVILSGYRGGEYHEPRLVRFGHRLLNNLHSGWVVNANPIVGELIREVHADPDTCWVVENGIEPDVYESHLTREAAKSRLGFDPSSPIVCIVAALRPEKNHEMFLQAAALLGSSHPKARFLIVGDGPERPRVENQIRELGIGGRVQILGFRSDVPDILRATDVSVLTSDWEGLSNTVVESMCAGLPVISTAYVGADTLVVDGEHGYLVPIGDAPALAGRIRELLDQPRECDRLGRNGLKMRERFSIDAMAGALHEIYADLLRQTGRNA